VTMRRHLGSLCVDRQGTTAVEFALIAPVFIALLFGMLGVCLALFLVASMHFAVEDGARCMSVNTQCVDRATTEAYAQSRYMGIGSPTFTYAAAACGNSVTGTISYSMDVGLRRFVIPVSATACFP